MNRSVKKPARELSEEDVKQTAKDLGKLLRLLLSVDPKFLQVLSDSVAAAKRMKMEPDLISSLQNLLTLGKESNESRRRALITYQDVRMLEKRHESGGLTVQDLLLLQCRHVLGRKAFLQLVKGNAFEWLSDIPLFILFREGTAKPRGAPLSPQTVSANIKLSLLIPPHKVIADEIEDNLREYNSKYEKQIHRHEIAQRAAKRVERALKKAGISSVDDFSQLTATFGPKQV